MRNHESYEELREKRDIERTLMIICFMASAFVGYLLFHYARL
ncbi:MAG: hypothetical protein QXJ02_06890 [Candidatus Bathyarchaeia archaeon]